MQSSPIETTAVDHDEMTVSNALVEAAGTFSPFAFPRPTDDAVKAASILVIDDEKSVLQLVIKYLSDSGFSNVHSLNDSTLALAKVESMRPDVVLLDLRMKPVNGLEILDTMRRNERTQHIPVIVLTSDTNEDVEITALNLGANDFLTKPLSASQLCARVRNTLSIKVYRDRVTDYSIKLESDVLCDALTGVANRRAFEYEMKRRIVEWNRHGTPFGLLMLDLDYFKKINDLYGHRVGDGALCEAANVITTEMRAMDLVARYGGEEFAIILPKTTIRDSIHIAERTRQALEQHEFRVEEQPIRITASVGVANAMRGDDANLLVRRADVALYSAKRDGRNRSYFHDGANCVLLTKSEDSQLVSPENRQEADGDRSVESAKVAIIDDEPGTVAVVRKYLKDAGFNDFVEVTDSKQALDTIRREQPDIVLLDIHMPHLNGFDILRGLRNGATASDTPVLIFTSESDRELKVKALNLGASDFLVKPVDASELLARIKNTVLAKSHLDYLSDYSSRLEHEVCIRTTELASSRREAIQCLARAGELRDDQTGQHVLRVGRYAATIAAELGFSDERVTWMEHAAQLHDVGKIGVPDAILHKDGKLTNDEWEVMKAHCLAGTRVLTDDIGDYQQHASKGMDIFENCNSPIMKMASLVAQTHHEKWDGSGYPRGLAGSEIPIEGRIAAVADVFDALSTDRPYKEAIPLDQCFKILEDGRGAHFDPDVLDAFFRRKSEIVRIFQAYTD